ncbi:hypothetical protein [Domibacillus mangrovi]|uniref:hypothetical protein n=1 Tax=Domibacillus mangrovi TaxID=1714354 RepID=UPI001C1F659A|nr:hypothetical protein [Domibacillus mangrovi]
MSHVILSTHLIDEAAKLFEDVFIIHLPMSPSLLITTVVDILLSFFCLATAFLTGTIFFRFGKMIGLSFLAFSGLVLVIRAMPS